MHNSSAKYSLQIDGKTSIYYRLGPVRAHCEKFLSVYLIEGDHNLTVRFEGGVNDAAPEGCINGWCPELRLTGIRYVVSTLPLLKTHYALTSLLRYE